MRFTVLIITLFLLLTPALTHGQWQKQLKIRHFNESNGLSGNVVYDLAQDHNGLIWMTTQNGLSRFDGKNFVNFRKDYNNVNSVSDNLTTFLDVDPQNRIWIGYVSNGISCYDQVTRTFTHFQPDSTNADAIRPGSIDDIHVDNDGMVWVGVATKGLHRLDLKTGKFKYYGQLPYINPDRSAADHDRLTRIHFLRKRNKKLLWMATADGLYSFDKEKEIFQKYPYDQTTEDIHQWKPDVFNVICQLSDTDFYLGGWGTGLNHYNLLTRQWTTFLLRPALSKTGTNNIISAIERKSDHELWVTSSDSVLSIFDTRKNKFSHLSREQAASYKLPLQGLGNMLTDRDGNLFIAHLNGISIIDQRPPDFEYSPLQVTYSTNDVFFQITSILEDSISNRVFLSTEYADGLNVIDSADRIQNFPFHEDKNRQFGTVLFNDSRNILWVMSSDEIFHFDRTNNRLVKVPEPVPDSTTSGSPYYAQMIEDRDGNLYLATYRHGIYIFHRATSTWTQLFYQSGNPRGLVSNTVTGIAFDDYQHLWIGYKLQGISRYDLSTGKYTHFRNVKNDMQSLIDDRVLCLINDQHGQILVGTGSGLSYIDPSTSPPVINNFNYEGRFTGTPVFDMIVDKDLNLWLVNPSGLHVYVRKDYRIKSFNHSNGLPVLYNDLRIYHGMGNRMFIGSSGGFLRFSCSIAGRGQKPGNVIFTSFDSGDKEIFYEQSIRENGKIELAAADNFFTVQFISVDYRDPSRVTYRHRLKGIEKTWRSTGTHGFASYSHLPGGDYLFEVQALRDGEWSEVTGLPVFIATPVVQTTWFRITMALLVAMFIFALYRYRIRSIEKTEALKTAFNRRIADIETKALRAQMNPHFIFNCLNSINRYIIRNDQKTASLYLTKFARLIRIILDNSENREVELSSEIEALKLYVEIESLRFDKKFQYEISADDSLLNNEILIPPMVIQPYVENAIWHGLLHKEAEGHLRISFSLEEALLVCVVEDDGIGREKSKEYQSKTSTRKSLGLKITAERIELLNEHARVKGGVTIEDLKNANGDAAGTRIIIKIPLHQL